MPGEFVRFDSRDVTMNREPVENLLKRGDSNQRLDKSQNNWSRILYECISEGNSASLEKFMRYFLLILPLNDAY